MVQVIVDLTEELNKKIERIKFLYSLSSKEEAIKFCIHKFNSKMFKSKVEVDSTDEIRKGSWKRNPLAKNAWGLGLILSKKGVKL